MIARASHDVESACVLETLEQQHSLSSAGCSHSFPAHFTRETFRLDSPLDLI